VLTTIPGSAERVARWSDPDVQVTALIGDPGDFSVDPDAAAGVDADEPDTEPGLAGVVPFDDEPDPGDAVEMFEDEDPPPMNPRQSLTRTNRNQKAQQRPPTVLRPAQPRCPEPLLRPRPDRYTWRIPSRTPLRPTLLTTGIYAFVKRPGNVPLAALAAVHSGMPRTMITRPREMSAEPRMPKTRKWSVF
jgi:hypothetical protein